MVLLELRPEVKVTVPPTQILRSNTGPKGIYTKYGNSTSNDIGDMLITQFSEARGYAQGKNDPKT